MFTGEHAQFLQILQIAVALLGFIGILIGVLFTFILKSLRDLRKNFDDFVRADTCRMHREVIEHHMREYENRIKEALTHCKKRAEDVLAQG